MKELLTAALLSLYILPGLCSGTDSAGKRGRSLLGFPTLKYAQETRFEYGLAATYTFYTERNDSTLRPSALLLSASYTQNRQSEFYFQSNTWSKGNVWHLVNEISLINYPYYFYGIGNETREADRGLNINRRSRFKTEAERLVIPHFYMGADLQYQYDQFSGVWKNTLPPEYMRSMNGGIIMTGGLSFIYDTRNHLHYTTKGHYLKLNTAWSPAILSAFDFSKMLFQSRSFFSSGNHTIGFHALAESLHGDPPFYELRQLGGANLMRGYYRGRFRDRHYLAGQVEYRLRFLPRFGASVFAGTGQVFDNDSFTLDRFKPNYGGGVRYFFHLRSRLTLRVDYGIGEKNSGEQRIQGVYFGVSEAF